MNARNAITRAANRLTPSRLTPRDKRIAVAGLTAAGAVAALAGTAAWVARKAREAEEQHPPKGRFVIVDGVRVHYVERGRGTPLILLHGVTLRLEDFIAGGLLDRLAERHRVIAFDRPGYGYSERPRDRIWTADAQADLIRRALSQLRIGQAVVLGQSWGALVALALALHAPAAVRKLILVSGYYFPTPRLDAALASPPAIPVIGDAMRYTVSAVFARLMLNRAIRAMFAPQPVPADYLPTLGREMLLRPSQIRADAEDAALLLPSAASLAKRYATLEAPALILAGEADAVVDPQAHSRKLHEALRASELEIMPGIGHMLHHAAAERLASVLTESGIHGVATTESGGVSALR